MKCVSDVIFNFEETLNPEFTVFCVVLSLGGECLRVGVGLCRWCPSNGDGKCGGGGGGQQ